MLIEAFEDLGMLIVHWARASCSVATKERKLHEKIGPSKRPIPPMMAASMWSVSCRRCWIWLIANHREYAAARRASGDPPEGCDVWQERGCQAAVLDALNASERHALDLMERWPSDAALRDRWAQKVKAAWQGGAL